jgi:NAD(P)-dependent dehydrogenase (short-subunit alcohol dehydrogenase family)
MALPLEGKVAIVTGSSRGIGKVTAITLAKDGADVVVCARSETAGEWPGTIGETATAVEAVGAKVLALRMDITQDEDIENVVEATMKRFGRIDILVNNAGLTGGGPFLETSPAQLDEFYRINVRGPFVLAQLGARRMAESGGGVIVNISSGAARSPAPPTGESRRGGGTGVVYGMSKAALDRFSGGIASELFEQNIAVVTLYPGFTVVERTIAQGRDPSRGESPETTAKAVAFVCRDPMTHTGQVYRSRDIVDQNGL